MKTHTCPQYRRMTKWQVCYMGMILLFQLIGLSQEAFAIITVKVTPNPARVGEDVTFTSSYVNNGQYYLWNVAGTPLWDMGLFR